MSGACWIGGRACSGGLNSNSRSVSRHGVGRGNSGGRCCQGGRSSRVFSTGGVSGMDNDSSGGFASGSAYASGSFFHTGWLVPESLVAWPASNHCGAMNRLFGSTLVGWVRASSKGCSQPSKTSLASNTYNPILKLGFS